MAFFRCVMVETTHVCNYFVPDLLSDLDLTDKTLGFAAVRPVSVEDVLLASYWLTQNGRKAVGHNKILSSACSTIGQLMIQKMNVIGLKKLGL